MRTGWKTDSGTHMTALHIELAPGWKTYWRAPGEAGIPPEFGWAGSVNLQDVRLHWPRPIVFDQNGMRSIGYDGTLVLPIEVIPTDPEISRALADQPRPAREAGLSGSKCSTDPIRDGLRLTAHLTLPVMGRDEAAVVELDQPGVWVSEAQISRTDGVLRVSADIVPEARDGFLLDRSALRITLIEGARAYELDGCPG
ncbi:protein-disulfide reductase DsbD domain-containing protein [Plastorhodobacter daqingensis]|uniref:Protein-disulfide reductase DsbD domain-containing protein n=1 Tax=Plastorhodobacter daqingensis TaxID=1387281 RepID=A0ABW2UQS2_9RHOB